MFRNRLLAETGLLHHLVVQIGREHFHELMVGGFQGLENFVEFGHRGVGSRQWLVVRI